MQPPSGPVTSRPQVQGPRYQRSLSPQTSQKGTASLHLDSPASLACASLHLSSPPLFCLWLCPVAGCLISLPFASDLFCVLPGRLSFLFQPNQRRLAFHCRQLGFCYSPPACIQLLLLVLATIHYTSTAFAATYLLINCPPHPQAISDRSAPFFLLTARSWSERPIQAFVAASHSPSLWTRCKLPSGRFYSLDL